MQRPLVLQTFPGPYHAQFRSISFSAMDTLRNRSFIILEALEHCTLCIQLHILLIQKASSGDFGTACLKQNCKHSTYTRCEPCSAGSDPALC